jgi:signal transduction histidine kinase
LGASDYLLLPLREAEVVNAVNRVLQQVHDRRERERLSQQLQQANQELQARVRELTTIFALGKAMTSVTEQSALMEMILDGAIRVTQADLGWFLLRDESERSSEKTGEKFFVVAERNLPPALGVRLNRAWDDGISSLVAMSGEPLNIHGDPLRRFKISSLGQAALIEPIKLQKRVIGLLVVMRKKDAPFGGSEQHLLDALADYASVSLVNARLFRTVEERARSLQRAAESARLREQVKNHILQSARNEMIDPVSASLAELDKIAKDPTARWRPDQRQALSGLQGHLLHIQQAINSVAPADAQDAVLERTRLNLTDLLAQSVQRLQPEAQQNSLTITAHLPKEAVPVIVEPNLAAYTLDSILSIALRFCGPRSQVSLHLEKTVEQQAYLRVRIPGWVVGEKEAEKIFDDPRVQDRIAVSGAEKRVRGTPGSLPLVKRIITHHNGQVWIENQANNGAELHIKLPLAR